MLLLNQNKKSSLFFIALIVFLLPSVFPLFFNGFVSTDDGQWMIIRFSAFHQALRDGQFPVRFLGRLNYEYGYPVANFLYPGFLYGAELFKVLGFNFIWSIKLILITSVIGSGVFCYLWLSKRFDHWSSLIGGLLYVYFPYHLYDLYKRGSAGELFALLLLPLSLYLLEEKRFFLFTIASSFLILSHNSLAVLFLPVVIAYIIIRFKDTIFNVWKYLLAVFLSLMISAFFWLPALYELQYTVFSETAVSVWQNYFADFRLIGYATLLVVIVSLALFFKRKMMSDVSSRLFIFFLILSFLSIYLSLSVSGMVWHLFPVAFIQFPFRFLSLTIVAVSFLVSYSLHTQSILKKRIYTGAILVLVFLSASSFIKQNSIFQPDSYYATNEDTTTVKNEYMPKWVKTNPIARPYQKIEVTEKGKNLITVNKQNSREVIFTSSGEKSIIRLNVIYYPGWKAFVDGREKVISYSNLKGVMEISLEKGNHVITFIFTETPFRIVSDTISIAGFLLFIVVAALYKNFLKAHE